MNELAPDSAVVTRLRPSQIGYGQTVTGIDWFQVWHLSENDVEPKLQLVRFVPICFALTALFASAPGVAQPTPIRETKGVEISHVESLDLTPWSDDVKGRQLRIRKLVFQPGGVVGLHSHDDRPDASYLVQGELTEFREGGYVKRRPGDTH